MDKEKEELIELWNNTNNQDRELFIKQYHWFRKVMCSTEYSVEDKDKEFQNLAQAYIRCNLNKGDIELFKAVSMEFEMRQTYAIMQ